MHIELLNQPGNTIAKIAVLPGESVTTKAGTLLSMSAHLQVSTKDCLKLTGETIPSKRRVIEGDRFICNHYECTTQPADLLLGSDLPGDMLIHELTRQGLIVNRHSFLAATQAIEIRPHNPIGSGDWLRISGSGTVVLSAFGALSRISVEREYQMVTGHIVSFGDSLEVAWPGKDRSWRTRVFRPDTTYCHFRGRGMLWYQSHNPDRFGHQLTYHQPVPGSA